MKRALLALGVLLIAAVPAQAQQDEEGCTDHQVFPRVPNFYISGCDSQEPSSFEFEQRGGPVSVEGHYWKIDYALKDAARQPTPLQIVRKYWNMMAAKGGTKLLEAMEPGGVTLTAKMPGSKGSGTFWLQVYVALEGEVFSLTIVQERPAR